MKEPRSKQGPSPTAAGLLRAEAGPCPSTFEKHTAVIILRAGQHGAERARQSVDLVRTFPENP